MIESHKLFDVYCIKKYTEESLDYFSKGYKYRAVWYGENFYHVFYRSNRTKRFVFGDYDPLTIFLNDSNSTPTIKRVFENHFRTNEQLRVEKLERILK